MYPREPELELLEITNPFSMSIVNMLDFLSPRKIVFGMLGSVNGEESINVLIGISIF